MGEEREWEIQSESSPNRAQSETHEHLPLAVLTQFLLLLLFGRATGMAQPHYHNQPTSIFRIHWGK